jgi:hypothetical protein
VLHQVAAIERLHNFFSFANPTATVAVHWALDQVVKVEPPRGWKREEKALFAQLPPGIRETIARREQDRESALRRRQNEEAKLRQKTAADFKESVKEETTMGSVTGSYNKDDDEFSKSIKKNPSRDGEQGRSIFRRVDKAADVNDGFSGELPKGE